MTDKHFDFNGKARLKLLRGATQLTDAVKITLGPRGRYVVLDRAANPPITTKDGVSVANEFELKNPVENMGAQVIKEIASKTEQAVGDGSTTATVIAHQILKESVRMVATGWPPMELKKGIEHATAIVIDTLASQSKPCQSKQMITQVATFAANGDSELGNLVADAFEQSSSNNSITVEQGHGRKDNVRSTGGLRIESGYLSPHFISGDNATAIEMEAPAILVYEGSLFSAYPLADLLESITRLNRPLLIVAQSVEGEALDTLVINHVRGILTSAAVKVPGVGNQQRALLEDIAALTGATVISSEIGLNLKSFDISYLGSADKVNINGETTNLIRARENNPDLETHLSHLRSRLDNATSEEETELLNRRLSNLTDGLTVIEIGGTTEQELEDRTSRLNDALSATKAAIEEGVVPGGGAGLLACQQAVLQTATSNEAQTAGMRIVARALEAPLRQIASNAGLEPSVAIDEVTTSDFVYGLDANSGEYCSLMAKGIVDPVKVLRHALQNASSAAGLLVTADCVISEVAAQPAEDAHI